MLDEQRRMYECDADTHISEDWRNINKNELFYRYEQYEKTNPILAQAYCSAIFVRYWNLIGSNYMKGKGVYGPEECYNWLVTAITITLADKPWRKIGGTVYNDPNGPDKCINKCVFTSRQGFYQWSNYKKRAQDYNGLLSLDRMMEDTGDANMPLDIQFEDASTMDIKNMVTHEFRKQNFMRSFIIDGIVNADVFDKVKDDKGVYMEFNKKKLSKHVRHLDDRYCREFGKMYDIPTKDVINARDLCLDLSRTRVHTLIRHTLEDLRKDPLFSKCSD
jgi:hypothetical protein